MDGLKNEKGKWNGETEQARGKDGGWVLSSCVSERVRGLQRST